MSDGSDKEMGGTITIQHSKMKAFLVIEDGPNKGFRFELMMGDNFIGRMEDCSVFLENTSVSRKHAMVNHTGDVLTIEDLGSSNGTLVNNNKIAGKVILNMNDAVRIGVYTLRVEIKKAFDMEGAKAPSDWEGRTMMAPRK